MLGKAIAAIEAQQETLKDKPAYWVGEQLKDILWECPEGADLVVLDLPAEGMGLEDCERKIAEYAKAHKSGSVGVCPPQKADEIIRRFYGIPKTPKRRATIIPLAPPEDADMKEDSGLLSLDDFL